MSEHRIAVYGSLRAGMGNNTWTKDNLESEGVSEVKGYKLYPLCGGAYPGINKSEDDSDSVVVELYKLIDSNHNSAEEMFSSIDNMEIGANYSREMITRDGKEYILYVYNRMLPVEGSIAGGDWVKYKKEDK